MVRFSPELSPTSTVFEASYDDGSTWTAAKAVGSRHLLLDHPAQPGTVSLRAKLTDRDGNTLVQTINCAPGHASTWR